jgi:hypothetical protein
VSNGNKDPNEGANVGTMTNWSAQILLAVAACALAECCHARMLGQCHQSLKVSQSVFYKNASSWHGSLSVTVCAYIYTGACGTYQMS